MQFTVFRHSTNFVSRTKFETPVVNASTLKEVFLKYGRSARHVFKLARIPSERNAWEDGMQANLRRIPDLRAFQDLLQEGELDITSPALIKISSQLVSLYPSATRSPLITLVSQHIADHLFDAVLKDNSAKFWDYFNLFWGISESHPTAGWLWESHVRHELSRGPKRKIPLIRLPIANVRTSGGQLSMDLPFPTVKTFGSCEDLANGLVRIAPTLQDGHRVLFLPGAKNQATYDAFAIPGPQLANATIAQLHDLSPKGLDFAWDAMIRAETLVNRAHRAQIRDLRPTSQRKWPVIFIIPRRVARHWKKIQTIDYKGRKPKRAWENLVEQFVMVLDDEPKNDGVITMPSARAGPSKAKRVRLDDEAEGEAEEPPRKQSGRSRAGQMEKGDQNVKTHSRRAGVSSGKGRKASDRVKVAVSPLLHFRAMSKPFLGYEHG